MMEVLRIGARWSHVHLSIISDGIVPCESRVVTLSEVTLLCFCMLSRNGLVNDCKSLNIYWFYLNLGM
jgi:hypothetical protein